MYSCFCAPWVPAQTWRAGGGMRLVEERGEGCCGHCGVMDGLAAVGCGVTTPPACVALQLAARHCVSHKLRIA